MEAQTLCDIGLKIQLGGVGSRAWVEIVDGKTVRFECRTRMLRDVLAGVPLQVSANQGYFMMERREGEVRIEYGMPGEGRRTCEFEVTSMDRALSAIERAES